MWRQAPLCCLSSPEGWNLSQIKAVLMTSMIFFNFKMTENNFLANKVWKDSESRLAISKLCLFSFLIICGPIFLYHLTRNFLIIEYWGFISILFINILIIFYIISAYQEDIKQH